MDKHVLVIADIEDDDLLSLEKAHDIAIDISASLEIVKFTQYDSECGETLEQFVANAQKVLDSMIAQVFEGTEAITSRVIDRENIDEWIVERCERHHKPIDLVIKGGRRTESLFHTPTDWKLIRHLHCPILIASHTKWRSDPNILMSLDLARNDDKHQQLNEACLEWGKLWSKATEAPLHAIYSIPIARPLLELDIVDKHEVEAKKAPEALDKLQTILSGHGFDSVTCHTPAGLAEKTIPHLAAELRSDVVIMGCLGREGVSGFLLGNTAEKVLHNVRTDCLIVKLPEDLSI